MATAFQDAVQNFGGLSPAMAKGTPMPVLGWWGPHRETSIDGVNTRNDTWTVTLDTVDGNTTVVADGTTNRFVDGGVYELSALGVRLGYGAYLTFEWGTAGGSAPAPGDTDWGWNMTAPLTFVAKPMQDRLSVKTKANGEGSTWYGPGVLTRLAVRRLS